MSRLHLFDMDGTLIRGSSACLEIARELGLVAHFQALERDLSAGLIDAPGYAVAAYQKFESLSEAQVAAAFAGAPWLRGIREVWADIRERGEFCAVISLSPNFFVERLREWGAHEARASVFPRMPFAGAELDPSGILRPETKVRVAEELCARFGVPPQRCVAYGDSLSDAPLFATVPTAVAINADHHVNDLASHSYSGNDLREAYALVR
ncbi:hydrolase [Wenjunlia vitaminophila]|uniref:Hydrolase n=1 Tax=Wenjunlia vitaminophila TaxID=76728 RepID=A0A0T6LMH7_WENVI|nr:HAD-IB family phosphatase [Wenjunlia vitaminophila]KRV47275.1 hydrolase [Wenjunlia vitaminophila]